MLIVLFARFSMIANEQQSPQKPTKDTLIPSFCASRRATPTPERSKRFENRQIAHKGPTRGNRLHAHALGRPSVKPKAGTPVNVLYALSIKYMGGLAISQHLSLIHI